MFNIKKKNGLQFLCPGFCGAEIPCNHSDAVGEIKEEEADGLFSFAGRSVHANIARTFFPLLFRDNLCRSFQEKISSGAEEVMRSSFAFPAALRVELKVEGGWGGLVGGVSTVKKKKNPHEAFA